MLKCTTVLVVFMGDLLRSEKSRVGSEKPEFPAMPGQMFLPNPFLLGALPHVQQINGPASLLLRRVVQVHSFFLLAEPTDLFLSRWKRLPPYIRYTLSRLLALTLILVLVLAFSPNAQPQ